MRKMMEIMKMMKIMKTKRVVSKSLGVVMGDRIPSIFHDWWTRASRVGR